MKRATLALALLMSLKTVSWAQGGQAFSAVSSVDTPTFQDRYLQIDVSNNLALNDAYSIETWVYVPSTTDGYVNVIESVAPSAGFGGYQLNISNGKVAATVYGFTVQTGFSVNTIAYDTWQHIAASYDGADELKVYLNGNLEGTFNFGIDNFNFGTDLYIGANYNAVANGESILVDEVRIWEDVRTATEISDNMNTCLTGQEDNLVMYYDFEQTPGFGFVTDQGPLGFHATIIHEQTNSFVTGVFSCCDIDTTTSVSNNTISINHTNGTFQWIDCDNNNAVISGETNQTFTPTNNGNYAAIITDGNCIDTTNCVAIVSIGLEENMNENINIYPNPASDNITIQTEEQIETIRVYDLSGALVLTPITSSFSIAPLQPGVYVMEVFINQNTTRKRILIQ